MLLLVPLEFDAQILCDRVDAFGGFDDLLILFDRAMLRFDDALDDRLDVDGIAGRLK